MKRHISRLLCLALLLGLLAGCAGSDTALPGPTEPAAETPVGEEAPAGVEEPIETEPEEPNAPANTQETPQDEPVGVVSDENTSETSALSGLIQAAAESMQNGDDDNEPIPAEGPAESEPAEPETEASAPAEPASAAIILTGACGDNLTWTLDSDGMLTISGTGKMWDFDEASSPWTMELQNYNTSNEIENNLTMDKVILEDGVTKIGNYAFQNAASLTDVVIPDTVTSMGWSAFEGCEALSEIDLPPDLLILPWDAFAECVNLEHIELPEHLRRIGVGAFRGCISLREIELPGSITELCPGAFEDCRSLEAVEFPPYLQHQTPGYYCNGRITEWRGDDASPMLSYHIPQINADSSDARRINEEILDFVESSTYQDEACTVLWELYEWGDWCSLVICQTTSIGLKYYSAYHYSFLENREITNHELASAAGLSEEGFLTDVRAKADEMFCRSSSWANDSMQSSPFYSGARALSVSSENISMDMTMFLDNNGVLWFASPIGSLAGASSYERVYTCHHQVDANLTAAIGQVPDGTYRVDLDGESCAVSQNGELSYTFSFLEVVAFSDAYVQTLAPGDHLDITKADNWNGWYGYNISYVGRLKDHEMFLREAYTDQDEKLHSHYRLSDDSYLEQMEDRSWAFNTGYDDDYYFFTWLEARLPVSDDLIFHDDVNLIGRGAELYESLEAFLAWRPSWRDCWEVTIKNNEVVEITALFHP